jgi:transposase InsO family protein
MEGIADSVGSVGDAYDNALMESIIGLYKTECLRPARAARDRRGRRVRDPRVGRLVEQPPAPQHAIPPVVSPSRQPVGGTL